MSEHGHGHGHGHGHAPAQGGGHGHAPAQAGGHGHGAPQEFTIDVSERGAPKDGQPQTMDRRLFMQLLVFTCDRDPEQPSHDLATELTNRKVPSVLYHDVNDPFGIGLLTWGEDPAVFVKHVRPAIHTVKSATLTLRPEFTMLGRSYSTGFEQDLEFWLLRRPAETVLDAAHPWHVWYPLRRSGQFARLDPREQGAILREHGTIGRAYGDKDLAHDVRLACHGLDAKDNEFLIGLIGKELYPLSHIVQTMRKTRQTSEFISQMGPFFVGRVAFRTPGK